jgi:hypothetical protein
MPATTRIAISGSYGGHNLGDEAILTAIMRTLDGAIASSTRWSSVARPAGRHGI